MLEAIKAAVHESVFDEPLRKLSEWDIETSEDETEVEPTRDKQQEDIECRVTLEDFIPLKLLGKGSFGTVTLVSKRHNPTEVYALKTLTKSNIVARHEVVHTLAERTILASVQHPNILRMKYAFETASSLCFALEYCPGIY